VHQGVGPFVLLNGLLGREKAMDQTTSLRRGEFLISSSSGYLRCRGSGNETPLVAEGHGRDNVHALFGLQPYKRTDSLRLNSSIRLPPVRKLETLRFSPSEGLSRCNLVR
jgi:hypothetical protein